MRRSQVTGVLLIIGSWVPCAWAVRADASEQLAVEDTQVAKFVSLEQEFCLGTENVEISCEDIQGTIIDTYSAVRNSAQRQPRKNRKKYGAKACTLDKSAVPCVEHNVKSEVAKNCDGKTKCPVPLVATTCQQWSLIRIKWDCMEGKPETADEDVERHELDGDSLETSQTTTSAQATQAPASGTTREQAPVEVGVEKDRSKSGTAPTPAPPPIKDLEEEEEVFAEKEAEDKARDVVKKKKEQDIQMEFNPCYRYTRWEKAWSSTFGVFSYLTSCPHREGCFRLIWPDDRTYTNSTAPPPGDDIMLAKLSKKDDDCGFFSLCWSTTWFSTGLERNHYDTWGICLPKSEGVREAEALFEVMKKH